MILSNTTNEDANLNYLKNRGEPGEWFQHKADYVEDKPVPRIRVGGYEIVEKLKPTIGEIIIPNKFDKGKPNDIHVRLTSADAKKIADRFNFQQDKWFDFEGNLSYKPPKAPRRVYTKTAEEIAENIWHYKSHDWFNHNRPKENGSIIKVNRCVGTEALTNSNKNRNSNADAWYEHRSPNVRNEPLTAPSSPKTRVKYEGIEYAARGRGIGAELLMHSTQYDQNYDESALPYRCVSLESGDNCRNQTMGSSMARCLVHKSTMSQRSNEPQDRVKNDEAREYLSRGRTGTMNLSVDGTSVSLQPKVRPEAEDNYMKAKGVVGTIIDQYQNKGYSSPQPAARNRTLEAKQAYQTNKGVMGSIVGRTEYPSAVYPGKIQARGIIGSDANEVMQKHIGNNMKELVENYRLEPDAPPQQRVGASGWEEGGLQRTASVGNLLKNYGQKPPPVVPPLRLSGAAVEVAEKYRAKDFFKTIHQCPPSK